MAAITRLGLFGYGVRLAGSFLRSIPVVVVEMATASARDGVVTRLATSTGVVTRVAATEAVVTNVTVTEWPTT